MAKSFFKEYVELKKKIERKKRYMESDEDFELNCSCFDSISRYLFSYRWCHSEREKMLLDSCDSSQTLSELAVANNISYNTLRSMSSRVSARLYSELGTDFQEIVLNKLSEDEKIAKVDKLLQPNELYLLQYGVLTREAYFKSADGKVINIPISPHIGTFRDSYLVTDFKTGLVDFRYYDNLWGIEPYHWSDGLEAIRIENVGRDDCEIYADTKIICKVGEITTIEKRQYSEEGLVSPDAVNGKSALL